MEVLIVEFHYWIKKKETKKLILLSIKNCLNKEIHPK